MSAYRANNNKKVRNSTFSLIKDQGFDGLSPLCLRNVKKANADSVIVRL